MKTNLSTLGNNSDPTILSEILYFFHMEDIIHFSHYKNNPYKKEKNLQQSN